MTPSDHSEQLLINACVVYSYIPISLEAPSLHGATFTPESTDGCMQHVTVSLSQPQPVEVPLRYVFHSLTQPVSCEGLRNRQHTLLTNVSAGKIALEFEVNLTNSGLDTRQTVYLTSWFTADGVAGPCSSPLPLLKTGLGNTCTTSVLHGLLSSLNCDWYSSAPLL